MIGCDINKHLIAQSTSVVVPGVPIPGSGTAGKHERRASIGLGISEVVVKSNADVRALTYCDLKVTFKYRQHIFSIVSSEYFTHIKV